MVEFVILNLLYVDGFNNIQIFSLTTKIHPFPPSMYMSHQYDSDRKGLSQPRSIAGLIKHLFLFIMKLRTSVPLSSAKAYVIKVPINKKNR